VVDVGVDADLSGLDGLLHRKIARGTANLAREEAMTDETLENALAAGLEQADEAAALGFNLIAIGEMGIGNTTSASAITCALTGLSPDGVTGRGTGIDDGAYRHKIGVIEGALIRHFQALPHADPLEILKRVGGLEIAAMTGMVLGAASHRMAVLCDGFISTAAAALAVAIEPKVRGYLFAGHQSVEPGHRLLLEYIGIQPLLELNMRLGEGTGAVLAMSLVESAVALYLGMTTFEAAGVSEVSG
jgi:nicotinate-nucleotide--dimethylbenzimidazole phosphoribosyltransferase